MFATCTKERRVDLLSDAIFVIPGHRLTGCLGFKKLFIHFCRDFRARRQAGFARLLVTGINTVTLKRLKQLGNVLSAQRVELLLFARELGFGVGFAVSDAGAQEAAVATGGTVANEGLLDQNYICRRFALFGLHRGPQSGKATADDE